MSLDESYPGIQPTTARKAGDLLTFTRKTRCLYGTFASAYQERAAAVAVPSSGKHIGPAWVKPAIRKRLFPIRHGSREYSKKGLGIGDSRPPGGFQCSVFCSAVEAEH
jgi:hypothetical protein